MQDGGSRDQSEAAVFFLIERGLRETGLSVHLGQVEKLDQLIALLAEWAPRINLTGHREPEEMAVRLVLDAAALLGCLPELQSASSLADLGTGAGFPGLPIAILCPDLHVCLVDSRKKRNHFQREVRRRLTLENVEARLGRAEEVEVHSSDVVVAQAMTQPELALELMLPWAKPGGLIVLPASSEASIPRTPPRVAVPERREYRVPISGLHRQLWVARVAEV